MTRIYDHCMASLGTQHKFQYCFTEDENSLLVGLLLMVGSRCIQSHCLEGIQAFI